MAAKLVGTRLCCWYSRLCARCLPTSIISIRRPSIFHCWPCFNSAAGLFFLAALRLGLGGLLGLLERGFIAAFYIILFQSRSQPKINLGSPTKPQRRPFSRTPSGRLAWRLSALPAIPALSA